MDHVGALSELKSKLRIPIAIHRLDANGLPLRPDILLGDGEKVSFGNMSLKVLHTPGHTPGSLCFWVGKHLISGDTIFPDDTATYPGHGDSTILRKEKEEFAIFSSRPHDPNLFGDVLWLSS
jgi:glyoxylase-like metal-dependent hydrolase (beta-lactamase superfamily II)